MVWYWHGHSLRIGLFRGVGWNWRGMCRQGVGVGWRIFANFGGIVATPLAFRAEMLASRGSLCVTLHHRNATTPSDLHYNASKHDLMHWICHSANIIITFITIQPQPLSPSISSHEQPSQNTHTHPLWVLNPMQSARTAATFSHETIHDNHYFSLWHSGITMAGTLFSLFSVYFSVILSKNLQNWKSAKLNHLPYRIIL